MVLEVDGIVAVILVKSAFSPTELGRRVLQDDNTLPLTLG
jgi:hypothetical protein